MGTSNWQNIPFCIDALMKIEPRRVLDIGTGYGRWGMIIREFCEVWYDRVFPQDWIIHIEGIEGFAANIVDYHHSFYNKVHIGDAREIIPTLSNDWDVVLFGDVLEHFERAEAEQMLNWALDHATYVIVNIPLGSEWPQADKYENPFERHLSEWNASDFTRFALRREAFFRDFTDRPFGSFILSRHDPKGLNEQLFSRSTRRIPTNRPQVADDVPLGVQEAQLLEYAQLMHGELQYLRHELAAIKSARGYRLLRRLYTSRYADRLRRLAHMLMPDEGGLLRAIIHRNPKLALLPIKRRLERLQQRPWRRPRRTHARVRVLGRRNPASRGSEAWLLAINPQQQKAVNLHQLQLRPGWCLQDNPATPSGSCLVSYGEGFLDLPAPAGTQLLFMTHPWSGKAELIWRNQRVELDLYSAETGTLLVEIQEGPGGLIQRRLPPQLQWGLAQLPIMHSATANGNGHNHTRIAIAHSGNRMTDADRVWLDQMTVAKPGAISVVHPEWLGVRSATLGMFPQARFVDDFLDEQLGLAEARLLIESGCRKIVIGGFPHSYVHLVTALHRLDPEIKIYNIWFGTFLQTSEDYAWHGFRTVDRLCRSGIIYKWGFSKKGMAEVMSSTGLRTAFVKSLVRDVPHGPSTPLPGGPHLGIWAAQPTWRKLPYAMLAAASMIDKAHVHASSVEPRAEEFARLFGLRTSLQRSPVPREQMPQKLANMHLNLYVTLSECAPMLPIESLALGTPCLFGPNSHYFEDHEYLRSRLIVPMPDKASVIAAYAQRALEERSEIIAAYRDYAPSYNADALASVEAFLEQPHPVEV